MQKLFEYNWQVREDWFKWCKAVPEEELVKERTGGVGSILFTLVHIIDVEYSWILELQGKEVPPAPNSEEIKSVDKVREFSAQCHEEVNAFVTSWTSELEEKVLEETNSSGEIERLKYGEVMRHVIAHEIHHIGQLSIWSREMNRQPVTANLIRRGLFEN
ncbi:DinB family protein [Jeotgalibacillus proteolyticus]|uniref:Damage-inducible protein DinB n=1 Tax=Jeotgalibacillus proteolyticus TaxID=2082395 RepID=A0A2S5G7V8_9BACL|nr:DinB family protein [Jeotgalibacillus proteolyticus]PPA69069.1 damage-inducible protein DinB [Jeotgalibacillus proteolyticus]